MAKGIGATLVAGMVAVGVSVESTSVSAQEAQQAPAPAAQSGSPAPAGQSMTLPDLKVVTTAEPAKKKKAKAKAKAKQSEPTQAAAAPVPAASPAGLTGVPQPETATGPVSGYAATRSATGMKTDTPLNETPQSVSVVGAEQIRDQGAQSIQDTLRYVPGVVADAYGFDSRTDSAIIRGTEAAEYLDGLRRSFSYYTFSYRVDPYFMERVEVLRGPASVLYGQAPVGGIINSVSKRPRDEPGGEITAEYGTFDFKQVKFDHSGLITTDGKWSYRVTGLARDADTQVNYVEDDRYAIAPAITYRPNNDTSVTVLGHFQKDETGSSSQFFPHVGTLFPNVNGRRIPRENFAGEPGDHYDTDVASGTLLFEHKFNSVFKLNHASRYADIHNDYDSTYAIWSAYTDANQEKVNRTRWRAITDTQVFNQDTNLEAKFATGLLAHKVLAGFDYSNFRASQGTAGATDRNDFNVYNPVYGQGKWAGTDCNGTTYDGVTTSLPSLDICSYSDQKITQSGLYIQDQIRLGNWIAVLGARKDWVENESGSTVQKDDAATYRAALMYEFASGFTPYFSYGESFVPVAGGPPSDPFDPQEGRMYELGFKYQPPGAQWMINSAIYDIAETNRVVYHDTNPAFYGKQISAVAIKGFEIELTGQVTENLKIVTGYSYTDAQYDDGTEVDGNQLESVPKHLASLWGVWEFDQPYLQGWSVGAGIRYIGESWDDHDTIVVPDVALFDAMIAYEEENWRWSINAKNLEDKEYVSTCLYRGDCWYGNARTITTSLTYKY